MKTIAFIYLLIKISRKLQFKESFYETPNRHHRTFI